MTLFWFKGHVLPTPYLFLGLFCPIYINGYTVGINQIYDIIIVKYGVKI